MAKHADFHNFMSKQTTEKYNNNNTNNKNYYNYFSSRPSVVDIRLFVMSKNLCYLILL